MSSYKWHFYMHCYTQTLFMAEQACRSFFSFVVENDTLVTNKTILFVETQNI